ncbi:MAG: V-type ATPase subunit [Clostridia bacterium]|nr:V-type ATPase subunit [Clostridia bacterium]
MPQPSYTYANARLAALSKRLLDPPTIRRMADGSLADALRTLQDLRYGGYSDGSDAGVEQLISAELIEAAEEIRALSPNVKMTDLFLLRTDIQNLKVLLKARMLQTKAPELSAGGVYATETLSDMVRDQLYDALPGTIAAALNALEKQLSVRVDPQEISVALDRAYLQYALETVKNDKVLKQYFLSLCDFDNILTFLRVRAMGGTKEMLDDLLLPEAGIKKQQLMETFDWSFEQLNRILSASVCREPLLAGLNAMQHSGNIGDVEKARDNYLISLFTVHQYETDSIYPIIGYLLAKERESRAIRLIVTAKRNRLPDSVIAERLVTLYGQR